ncbi:MAG: ribonuclease HII, partial [Candidatus ainarchaeum sp.]|nr:ribonuclease HII [Candidatus ainarchaeum sp.]
MANEIAGVDEAGRGSVLGSLIIALAYCKRKDEKKLNSVCKKDSKQLTQKQREETFEELKKICKFEYIELTAKDLNKRMEKQSLNDIEAEGMAALIKKIGSCDVMIDLPDRYGWIFKKRMDGFGVSKFEAEHKADEKYPIVAA